MVARAKIKRPREDLCCPSELPPGAAPAASDALERWAKARARAQMLRPVLEKEELLIQEILDHGLRKEDRKTLRRLATGGSGEEEAETLRQVAASLGAQGQEKLQAVLTRNHHDLLNLTSRMPEDKEAIVRELEKVKASLRQAQTAVHSELLRAKESGSDLETVRSLGRAINDLKELVWNLEAERQQVTKNSALAVLLVTVCRRVLPIREIDPADLHDIEPSHEGYLRIMEFYFFSDAGKYCFGEHYSGPNWFTRLKRNVAILVVFDQNNKAIYNQFAVSGEHNTPGAPLAPEDGVFEATEAEDEYGRLFARHNDAEFKLLSSFAVEFPDCSFSARGVLWSKKPLCTSCAGAVRQFAQRYPNVPLEVVVGGPAQTEEAGVLPRRPAPVLPRRPRPVPSGSSGEKTCSCSSGKTETSAPPSGSSGENKVEIVPSADAKSEEATSDISESATLDCTETDAARENKRRKTEEFIGANE